MSDGDKVMQYKDKKATVMNTGCNFKLSVVVQTACVRCIEVMIWQRTELFLLKEKFVFDVDLANTLIIGSKTLICLVLVNLHSLAEQNHCHIFY